MLSGRLGCVPCANLLRWPNQSKRDDDSVWSEVPLLVNVAELILGVWRGPVLVGDARGPSIECPVLDRPVSSVLVGLVADGLSEHAPIDAVRIGSIPELEDVVGPGAHTPSSCVAGADQFAGVEDKIGWPDALWTGEETTTTAAADRRASDAHPAISQGGTVSNLA